MKYKLFKNSTGCAQNILKSILNNRGICDYNKYLNLDNSVEIHYSNLNDIDLAVKCFDNHYSNKNVIGILFDTDVDGITSGSEMLGYIKKMDNSYPVKYILHKRAKAHGLSDDVVIPDDIKLLIIPDAASNDIEQCKKLKENGIDIIILDHHEVEKKNEYAIVVNNQISNKYSNKALSGAGVVYKFLQALDDYYWNEYADEFIDLVSLGLIGDMMDIRSYETKYLIDKGLKNIKNKCLNAFLKAQDYSMNGKVNIHNMQWYIVPVINAMIRVGKIEEIELLIRAFSEYDEIFKYNKKKTKSSEAVTIDESIYDRAARLSKNTKSRQDKLKEKSVVQISEKVDSSYDNDKVIIVDGTEIVDNGLTGVVAIKIAEKYNKPCIILNKHKEEKKLFNEETGELEVRETYFYGGSSRNMNNSPIESLKDVVNDTKVFDFAQGHQSAFGVRLQLDKVEKAKSELNKLLKDIIYESTYNVDFILQYENFSVDFICEIDKLSDVFGQGIDEVFIAIEDCIIKSSDILIFGKNNNTLSFVNSNGVKFVMFNCDENNKLFKWATNDNLDSDNTIDIKLVGKPCINRFNGVKTPQFIITDVEVIGTYNTDNEEIEDEEDEVW